MSSFSRAYTAYTGREGVKGRHTFVKMSFMTHCNFEKWSQHQLIKNTLSREGGGHKKSNLCTVLIMLIILDDLSDHGLV